MSNALHRSIVLLMLMMLTACGTVDTVSSWFESDTYEAPPTELIEFVVEFEPQIAWSTSTGEGASNEYDDFAAWLQSDSVVAVDYEGQVSSYHSETGKSLWRVELDVPVSTGAGGGEGLILIGTYEGELFALNESNGELLWKKKLSSEVLAPAKVAMGIAIVRTSDGKINGLSVSDGSVLWSYQRAVPLLSLRGAGAPVLAEDKVIAGYANGKLVALSITDGKVVWEKSVTIPRGRSELDRIVDIDSEPVVKDGIVYVVAYNGQLAALDLDSGRKLWSRNMSSRSGLDVAPDDAVYVTDNDGYVWALQDDSGDALWRQTRLLRRRGTAPVIVGDNVIVGDLEGYVHLLSRQDGHFVARLKVADSPIRSKPIVKNELVFITATDGSLIVLRVH
ncbi:MAG: outer membrane protein assembly factor BamB [Piscirickettsiaceae bacterium]|nr:outer membrane protein assembly factor BamB [Piscirickettsiaceae bacterium]